MWHREREACSAGKSPCGARGTGERGPVVDGPCEWAAVIAAFVSVLSVVPRRRARLSPFLRPKLRKTNAVLTAPQPITPPPPAARAARSKGPHAPGGGPGGHLGRILGGLSMSPFWGGGGLARGLYRPPPPPPCRTHRAVQCGSGTPPSSRPTRRGVPHPPTAPKT